MFHGENLANLRIMHGLSRKQLAVHLSTTEQAIWQYENQYMSPDIRTVTALKQIFSVRNKYFYAKDVISSKQHDDRIQVMNIAYRSKMLQELSKTQTEAKHLEFLDVFVSELTSSLRHPTLKILQIRDEAIAYLNTTADSRANQIEKIASLARQRLGLNDDSNENLMHLIEKSGVFIFEKAIGKDTDAYSLWTKHGRSYMMLGSLKRSAARRNFDIAHELGHLLLHNQLEFTSLDSNEHKKTEKEANIFACALLLPKVAFLEAMKNIDRLSNPDAYIDLKRKWQTSLQVLGYRAAGLGLMEAKDHRNFYAALHRKDYLKQEPLDTILPLQKPLKIKSMIDFATNKGLLNLKKMIETDWHAEVPFFAKLTGIEAAFFEKYVSQGQNTKNGKVMELRARMP